MPAADPLDALRIRHAMADAWSSAAHLSVIDVTGSTNADVADAARQGAPHGTIIVAGHQTAGRGRFVRQWSDARDTSIAMSVLLRPPAEIPLARWGWLPLVAGLGIVDGLRQITGLPLTLKWPNDVLLAEADGIRPGKVVGILAEGVQTDEGMACVVGVGINVRMGVDELPVETASSLFLGGVDANRSDVVAATLRAWDSWYSRWLAGDDLRDAYQSRCGTIGTRVRAQLDTELGLGEAMLGTAVGVDAEGSLIVLPDGEQLPRAVSAGDVVHLRRG